MPATNVDIGFSQRGLGKLCPRSTHFCHNAKMNNPFDSSLSLLFLLSTPLTSLKTSSSLHTPQYSNILTLHFLFSFTFLLSQLHLPPPSSRLPQQQCFTSQSYWTRSA